MKQITTTKKHLQLHVYQTGTSPNWGERERESLKSTLNVFYKKEPDAFIKKPLKPRGLFIYFSRVTEKLRNMRWFSSQGGEDLHLKSRNGAERRHSVFFSDPVQLQPLNGTNVVRFCVFLMYFEVLLKKMMLKIVIPMMSLGETVTDFTNWWSRVKIRWWPWKIGSSRLGTE